MSQTVVGVLRGGPSSEYDVSLKTGAAILDALSEEEYRARDILIDKNGIWHQLGRPMDPPRILEGVDVVVNGLHGTYGEDGTVQRILERIGVPYTGSRPEGSVLSMQKPRAKEIIRTAGIFVPRGVSFSIPNERDTWDMSTEVFNQFAPPYIIKPARSGSSSGLQLAPTLNDLNTMLADSLDEHQSILVEEYIPGSEATVGVVDDFREQEFYALPPVEIMLDRHQLFDYETKYCDSTKEICPSTFPEQIKRKLEASALIAHQALGLRHYSRSDFRVHPSGAVYFLETNSLPGLTENSLMPKSLQAVGSSLKEFLSHIINKALRR